MPFIGVITERKKEVEFANRLKEKLDEGKVKAEIILINENSIENIRNVKFSAIFIGAVTNVFEQKEKLIKLLEEAQYVIINADLERILDLMKNIETTVISYGFNSKSTITASSVGEERILICVQREFENIFKQKVEPQEISVKNELKNEYISMGIASICLLYGIKCNIF